MNSALSFLEDPIEVDQLEERPMEARIARIESDVAHINDTVSRMQVDLRDFRNELKAANESLTELKLGQMELAGRIDNVEVKLGGRIDNVEVKLGGRIDGVEANLSARIDKTELSLVERIARSQAETDAKISSLEARLIKWIVGTAIATTGVAFTIARVLS